MKMKFFKFNVTPLGVLFSHGDNSYCPQVLLWQPFVMNVSRNAEVKRHPYLAGYWNDLVRIWYIQGVFLDSKSKTNSNILQYDIILTSK